MLGITALLVLNSNTRLELALRMLLVAFVGIVVAYQLFLQRKKAFTSAEGSRFSKIAAGDGSRRALRRVALSLLCFVASVVWLGVSMSLVDENSLTGAIVVVAGMALFLVAGVLFGLKVYLKWLLRVTGGDDSWL